LATVKSEKKTLVQKKKPKNDKGINTKTTLKGREKGRRSKGPVKLTNGSSLMVRGAKGGQTNTAEKRKVPLVKDGK